MHDEFSARQRAISLRLAGRSVKEICLALNRSEVWFRKWWRRYLELGVEGLFDLTRANHHVARRIPPEVERTILSIRRRLEGHTGPGARYRLVLLCVIAQKTRISWVAANIAWRRRYLSTICTDG